MGHCAKLLTTVQKQMKMRSKLTFFFKRIARLETVNVWTLLQWAPHKMKPHVFLGMNFSLYLQVWPWYGPFICPAPLASTWWGSSPSWWHSSASWVCSSPGSSGTYTWGLHFTGVYCICNCIFHRSHSILRFFNVCILPCADADKFSYPRTKTFCFASFLVKKRKRRFPCWQVSFFWQENSPDKKLLP